MADRYLTVAGPVEAELEVKRSRFRCLLTRVPDEDAAREVVAAARKTHWDARHHCSAMILGPGRDLERSSDDGEPAGTAGAAMLEVLRGQQLSDVVAVVTRWFGGVLLGAGGLVRAYGDAVRAAVDDAVLVQRELMTVLALGLDHADAGRIEAELRAQGTSVLGARYGQRVTLELGCRPGDVASLQALIAQLTAGQSSARATGEQWVDRPP